MRMVFHGVLNGGVFRLVIIKQCRDSDSVRWVPLSFVIVIWPHTGPSNTYKYVVHLIPYMLY